MSHLLQGAVVPGTLLRARRDVGMIELLRVIGPQVGSLYQELMSVPESSLSRDDRARRRWLEEWLEPVDQSDVRAGLGVREL